MGVGIGGDYPLSAVISSEFASTKIRGRMMAAVFANQGWGNFGQSAYQIPLHFFPISELSFRSCCSRRIYYHRRIQESNSCRNGYHQTRFRRPYVAPPNWS